MSTPITNRACVPSDTSASGTIISHYQKLFRMTAFGLAAALLLAQAAAAAEVKGDVFPASQTVHFGAKTLGGFGGVSLGYTGSLYLGMDQSTCTGVFVLSGGKMVPAGTSGQVPASKLTNCSTTVREYNNADMTGATGKASAVTVMVDPNQASVSPSTDMAELRSTLLKTGPGQLTCYDTVSLRSGEYGRDDGTSTIQFNATSLPTWTACRIAVASSAPDGSTDSNGNARRGGGAVIHRLKLKTTSTGCLTIPIDFDDIDFALTSQQTSESIAILGTASCVLRVRLHRPAVYTSGTSDTFWPTVQGVSLVSGYAEVYDGHFSRLEQGVAVGGLSSVVEGNVFEQIAVDPIKVSRPQGLTVVRNLVFAVRHDLNPCGHNDIIQVTYNNEATTPPIRSGGLIKDNYGFAGQGQAVCNGKTISNEIHGLMLGDFYSPQGDPAKGTYIAGLVVINNAWYSCAIPGYTTGGGLDSTMRYIAGLCPTDSLAQSDYQMRLSFSGYYEEDCATGDPGGTKSPVRGVFDHFIINTVVESHDCPTEDPHPGATIDSTVTSRVWDRSPGYANTLKAAFPNLKNDVHNWAGAIKAWTPARGGAAMNADGTYAGPLFPANDFGEVCDNDGSVFDATIHCTPVPAVGTPMPTKSRTVLQLSAAR